MINPNSKAWQQQLLEITIARSFVELHKQPLDDWINALLAKGSTENQILAAIFANLIGGVYGEVTIYDDGQHEIEIDAHSSRRGHAFLHTFYL